MYLPSIFPAVYITDNSCTKNGNSSYFKPKIRGLYTRAVTDQEGACTVLEGFRKCHKCSHFTKGSTTQKQQEVPLRELKNARFVSHRCYSLHTASQSQTPSRPIRKNATKSGKILGKFTYIL